MVSVTSRNATSVAPSGSGTVIRSATLPLRSSSRLLTTSRPSIAVTVPCSALPQRVVVVQRLAPADHRLDVRPLGERRGVEPPHVGEGRVVQAQPAVAAEHRDRLGQIVERLALHADQRIVAPHHVEPLGDVLEQIGHAALRVGRGDDADGAAVRQVPEMLRGSVAR